jgi:hypothetical protein
MTIEQPLKPELPRDPDVLTKPGGAEAPEPDPNTEKPEIQPTPPPTDPEPPAI